jgi:hypothetical protein
LNSWNAIAKLVAILVILLLGWDENISTLQENKIKINTSFGIKNPPHHRESGELIPGLLSTPRG